MRIVKSNKAAKATEKVCANTKGKVIYDKDGIVVKTTGKDYDFIATIENNTDEDYYINEIDMNIPAHDWVGLLADEDGYNAVNYFKWVDVPPLTEDQVRDLWDKKALFIEWSNGSGDSMCQDNGYTLDEILEEMKHGGRVYVDEDPTEVEACGDVKCSTGENSMRIVKSNKTVKASAKITKALKAEIFEELEAAGGYFNYDRAVDELISDYSLSRKDAESLVWQFTTRNNIECCGDVKASKQISANDQALQHIKAAIDILGKSGQKDDITKDSIANLGVVMFDLKGNQK